MEMSLTSSVFVQDGPIPKRYTCEGDDVSPPLAWSHVPAGTRSLVLIVDDPDVPADCNGLPEAVSPLPPGALEGLNDWERTSYGGPCPPIGRHRYFHKLYALDTVLPDLDKPTKKVLEEAMQGRILAVAQLMGTYQKEG